MSKPKPKADSLPSVDPQAAEIIKTITEFEASVTAAECALVVRDWLGVDAALTMQHRLTHALSNLLDETRDKRPQAFTDEAFRRIAAIYERRDDQMRRLVAYNHLVRERLTMISRSRELRRPSFDTRPAAQILNILQ